MAGMTKAISSPCLAVEYVDGHATAATVAGMKYGDELIQVLHFTDATGFKFTDDITATCAVTTTATSMTCPDTASDKLLVIYHSADGSAGTSYPALNLNVAAVTGGTAVTELTCAGTTLNDTIVMGLHLTAGAVTALLANSTLSIPTAGKFKTSIDTSGDVILVYWIGVDEGLQNNISSPCMKGFKADTVVAETTAIAVTGIEMGDTLLSVIHVDTDGIYQADDTANCSVSTTADGYIYSTTTFGVDTGELIVLYHDASA